MVEIAALVGRIRGMIMQPEATLVEHAEPAPPWRLVLKEHAIPLVSLSAIVSLVLFYVFVPGQLPAEVEVPGIAAMIFQTLVRIVINVGLISLVAAIVMFFSGMFGGLSEFNRAYVLAALAMTPVLLAEAILPIPVIGLLAFLMGLVYSFIVLYRGTALVLKVPEANRGKHFGLTVGALIIVLFLGALVLGPLLLLSAS